MNGHLYSGDICPGPEVIPWMEDPLYYVCISYLCCRDTSSLGTLGLVLSVFIWRNTSIQGTLALVPSVFIEGTPLSRGHLAWSWVCLLKEHLYPEDTWPGPECVYWRNTSIQRTLGLVLSVFIEGTPLFRGHMAVLVPSVSPEGRLHCTMNRPFPSSPRPLYQNEVKCPAFDMEMIFILMQIKLFTWKVVHSVSFWKWGFLELGSGQFVGERKMGMLRETKLIDCLVDCWSLPNSF